jgi:hypothetical protein
MKYFCEYYRIYSEKPCQCDFCLSSEVDNLLQQAEISSKIKIEKIKLLNEIQSWFQNSTQSLTLTSFLAKRHHKLDL